MASVSVSACAQIYRPVAPPAPMLSRPVGTPASGGTFDPFQMSSTDQLRLHPWQTLDIPPGSQGDLNVWDYQQLNSTTIERYRQSFVQKVELTTSFVNRNQFDGLGYITADAAITMVVPLGSTSRILVFTPRYAADWLDGPGFIDAPPYLQGLGIDIGFRQVFNEKWSLIAGVQPSFFNDTDVSSEAFRMGGLALFTCQMIPEKLAVSLGIVYLDQADYNLLPGVGVTWTPNPDTRFDLNFPKPKIGKRVSHIPYILEDWLYLAGTFGGGTWAVRRVSGDEDVLNLRDFRLSAGFERVLNGGTGFNIEAGYVFSRRLEYRSLPVRFDLTDSFIIEAGLRF